MVDLRKEKLIKILENEEGAGIFYNGYWLVSTMEGQKVLENAYKNHKLVVCTCNGNRTDQFIKMYIRKLNRKTHFTYILCRNPNTQHLHHPNCPNYDIMPFEDEVDEKKDKDNEKEVSKSIKNKFNLEGNWTGFNFRTNLHIDKELKEREEIQEKKDIERKETRSRFKSIFSIGETILSNAWACYVTDSTNYYNPTEGQLFYTIYNKLNDYIITDSDKNQILLSDIMFQPPYGNVRGENIDKFIKKAWYSIYNRGESYNRKGYLMYVLAKVLKIQDSNNGQKKLILLDPFKKNVFSLYASENLLKSNLKNVPGAEYYITCFVDMLNDKPTISCMAIIPVLKGRGIYMDSSYEIEFAEELIKKNILFIRPPQSNNVFKSIFNNYIPDFLFLDRKTREIATIVEVFGYYTEEYLLKAHEKVRFYKTLKADYNLLYWNAIEGHPIPNIYEPRKPRKEQVNVKF